jgi:hypothetical protein
LSQAVKSLEQVEPEAHQQSFYFAADQQKLRCVRKPEPTAIALLSQVLAFLHGIEVPVVQFVQVSGATVSSGVARSLAEASLACLGRTLLVSFRSVSGQTILSKPKHESGFSKFCKLDQESTTDTADIIPDAQEPNLFHARIEPGLVGSTRSSVVPPAIWLGEVRTDFRLMILDCGSFASNPGAIELASRCHATIFTVCRAETSLSEIHFSARQLHLAGGRLLGTVLYDAQPSRSAKSIQSSFRWYRSRRFI